MARKRLKRETVSQQRVTQLYRNRFDPIPYLTPKRLAEVHQAFRRGHLGEAARLWEAIRERDPLCATVIPKREKSMRYGVDFVMQEGMENDPQAQRHKDALQYFYESMRTVNVIDQNQRGGLPLLIRQMMSATGFRYAVHELEWEVRGPEQITATAYFCPLHFFENTTGRLRYLEREGALYGRDLEPGAWLTTVGDGLMFATSTAYMYKTLPLRDLLNYCERYAIPGLHGKTDAQPGTAEWDTLVSAVQNFAIDWGMVTSTGAQIDKIDVSASGTLPHPQLIDYMDRAITLIWRGGDLSTLSRADSVGASVQESEMTILEQDDAQILTDTLNEQIDRQVIRYLFDEDPLCWVKVRTAQRQDIKQDIEIDRFLGERGFPQTLADLASRYGRTLPAAGEKVLPPMQRAEFPGFSAPGIPLVNAERPKTRDLLSEGVTAIARAQRERLRPVADELLALYRRSDMEGMTDAEIAAELQALQRRLPDLLAEMGYEPETEEIYAQLQAAAWGNGMEGAQG